MAKVCEERFPKGSYKNQMNDGFFMDDLLKAQIDILLKNIVNDWDFTIIISGSGEVRVGKCQPKGSKVLMADGKFKNIEDIKIGDKVISPIIDENGNITKTEIATVKDISNYISPKNYTLYTRTKKSNKKIKLYECSENHLIPITKVKYLHSNKISRGFKMIHENIMACELAKMKISKLNNLGICTYQGCKIESFGNEDCEIEPYTLGVYLGDGSFMDTIKFRKNYKGNKVINVKSYYKYINSKKIFVNSHTRTISPPNDKGGYCKVRHLNITSADKDIIKEISKYYPIMSIHNKKGTTAITYNFSINGKLAKQLIKYGLNGKNSDKKFIPESAKLSSIEYRKRLLAGLIDTDGYVNKKNHLSITTKSKKLAEDILFIVHSLGGNGYIKNIKKKCKGKVFDYFEISFHLGELQNKLPQKNKFKINRLKEGKIKPNKVGFILEEIGEKEVYGISLDNQSQLYITDNFCITHNSVLAQQIGAYWIDQIKKLYNIDLPWNLEDNFVFDGQELIKKGNALGSKYKYACLVYDEAGADLDTRKTMYSSTQQVLDYLRECGQYNMLNILVLPDFFTLPKAVAITRSIFLLDVTYTADKEGIFQRGTGHFYSRYNKKRLYLQGKKEENYSAYPWNFAFRFLNFYTVDEEEYRKLKYEALVRREKTKKNRFQMQRDAAWYILHNDMKMTLENIGTRTEELIGIDTPRTTIGDAIKKFYKENEENGGLDGADG